MNKQINDSGTEQPYVIMTLILNDDQYDEFMNIVKYKDSINKGITMLGKGTVKSATLNFIGIKNQKRTVTNILFKKDKASEVMDKLTGKFQLDKPGHGIVFTIPVLTGDQIISNKKSVWDKAEKMEGEIMLNKLTVIVNRGMADDVMDISRKAGAKGGTILHGHGVGSAGDTKVFGIEIELEKEVVIVILPSEMTEKVVNDLTRELKLDEPGNGILYVEPVLDVRGIRE